MKSVHYRVNFVRLREVEPVMPAKNHELIEQNRAPLGILLLNGVDLTRFKLG
jgi:hypothetical protein